jgi:predicted adenine nucleotide alpha hydrolase (AANH) superfamily ATPase
MNINYAKEMDKVIARIRAEGREPRLLLHVCCAPCSSAVLQELWRDFDVTIFFDNPNIDTAQEFDLRRQETEKLVALLDLPILVIVMPWDTDVYHRAIEGTQDAPEGGARCARCFALRLDRSAAYAKAHGFDWFTTTLTVGPRKDAALLNSIGQRMAQTHGVPFLPSDFKKRDGYLNSIRRSREYNLYRQDYCGCVFSKAARNFDGCAKPKE